MYRFTITTLAFTLLCNLGVAQSSMQNVAIAALSADDQSGMSASTARDEEPAAKGTAHAASRIQLTASNIGAISLLGSPVLLSLPFLNTPTAQTPDFISFEGSYIKDLVRLNWVVRPKADALGFSIERRSQADEHWSTLSYLRADIRQNENGYSFYDRSGIQGVTYYRIRQVGSNGKDIPTPAICVMPHLVPNSLVLWQHKIDPFTRFGTLSFGLGSSMPVTVTMVDCYGRSVATLVDEREMESGHHIIPFNTAALPSGIYSLQIETSVGMRSQRVAVL